MSENTRFAVQQCALRRTGATTAPHHKPTGGVACAALPQGLPPARRNNCGARRTSLGTSIACRHAEEQCLSRRLLKGNDSQYAQVHIPLRTLAPATSAAQFQLSSMANNPEHVASSSHGTPTSCSPVKDTAAVKCCRPGFRFAKPDTLTNNQGLWLSPAFVTVRFTSTAKSVPCRQAVPSRKLTVHCLPTISWATARASDELLHS